MKRTIGHKLFRMGIIAPLAVALSACATFNPYYVSHQQQDALKAYETSRTYANAQAYAEKIRENYYDAISDNAYFSSGTAVTTITLASILAYNAITNSGSTATNAGYTVGAGGLLSTYQFLYSKPRLAVYAAGAAAISCTLDAFGPLTAANTMAAKADSDVMALATATNTLAREIAAAEAVYTGVDIPAADAARINSAKKTLSEAQALTVEGQTAIAVVKSAHARLYAAAESIRSQTVRELQKSDVDMQAFVAGLGGSIPFGLGLLPKAPQNAQTPATSSDKKLSLPGAKEAIDKMEAASNVVAGLKSPVSQFLSVVGEAPAPERIKDCAADIARATPVLTVELDRTELTAGHSATIMINNGHFPYAVTWVGQLPNDKITKTLSYESSRGVITVNAQADAEAGTYNLSITDATNAKATAYVEIKAGTPTKPAKETATTTGDPLVRQIQEKLLKLGYKDVDVTRDGVTKTETLTVVGNLGPITKAALAKFYKDQGARPEDYDLGTDDGKKALIGALDEAIKAKNGAQ